MSLTCAMLLFGPLAVIGFLAYQNRKAAEARAEAEIKAAQQGLTLPPQQSVVGNAAGAVVKAAVEAALKHKRPPQ